MSSSPRFSRLLLAAALFVMGPRALAAQDRPAFLAGPATLHLAVIDSSTGAPMARLLVHVTAAPLSPPPRGRGLPDNARVLFEQRLDRQGRQTIRRLPEGTTSLEVYCPDRDGPWIPVLVRRDVQLAGESVVEIRVPTSPCEVPTPPKTSRYGRYHGFLGAARGFSSFFPCADAGGALLPDGGAKAGRYADVVFARRLWMAPSMGEAERDSITGGSRAWVRWAGTLSGPGRYGKFGRAMYEMRVDSIFEIGPPAGKRCGPPATPADTSAR